MTASKAQRACCDFSQCKAFEWVEVQQVPYREALTELGWWIGAGSDPLLFCPTHYRQDAPFPAVGIYPHCRHCRPCRTELAQHLHFRPCQHNIACPGAKPA